MWVRILGAARTCAPGGQLVISETFPVEPVTANAASVSDLIEVDGKLLDDVAGGLGINCGDGEQVKDLVAVAMTRLAWRNGPVEDWHSIRHRRIDDGEIMRANAATTRVVRDAMDQVREPGGMFKRVGQVLADPHRQLPDGRMVTELAPSPLEFARYQAHVAACCTRWESTAADIGEATVLTLLACRGARFNWHWWRSTGWLRLVDEFIRRLDDSERSRDAWELINRRRLGDPPGGMTSDELRLQLLAGPDRLDTATARFCLRAGLSRLLPHHCGLPPVLRHPLPAGYFALIEADTPTPPSETDAT